MSDETQRLSQLIAELRRRHVFKAAVWYLVAVFGVLQVADIVLEAFAVSDQVLRLLVVLSVLGLPLVLVLAWVYELTPSGLQTMTEVDQLRTPTVGVGHLTPRLALLAVTTVAVTGAAAWWVRTSPPLGSGASPVGSNFVSAAGQPGDVPIRSVGVLPLQSFSADGEQDYFALGMHEALITELTQQGVARVISRTSVMAYDASGKSVAQIGDELGVEGIVTGSVTIDGDEVRITVGLTHAPSDTQLFSQSFVRDMTGVIDLQNEVATVISQRIRGQLDGQPSPVMTAAAEPMGPVDPNALRERFRGQQALRRGGAENLRLAEEHFQNALGFDSTFYPVLMDLAEVEIMKLELEGASEDRLASARRYVADALQIYPDFADAIEVGFTLDGMSFGQAPGTAIPAPPTDPAIVAEGEFEISTFESDGARVVVVSDGDLVIPNITEAGRRVQGLLGRVLARVDSSGRGLRAARFMQASGIGDAVSELQSALDADPTLIPAWDMLERKYVLDEDFDQVLALRVQREEALGTRDGFPTSQMLKEYLDAEPIDGYWRWRLDDLEARAQAGQPVSGVEMATAYAALAETEAAFEHLQRALEERDRRIGGIESDPVWDSFRGDQRFQEVLEDARQMREDRGRGRSGRGAPDGRSSRSGR